MPGTPAVLTNTWDLDWTLDLLSDQSLFHHFTWDAERLYKYDGESFVRFIDEPRTADRFWEIQVAYSCFFIF